MCDSQITRVLLEKESKNPDGLDYSIDIFVPVLNLSSGTYTFYF